MPTKAKTSSFGKRLKAIQVVRAAVIQQTGDVVPKLGDIADWVENNLETDAAKNYLLSLGAENVSEAEVRKSKMNQRQVAQVYAIVQALLGCGRGNDTRT